MRAGIQEALTLLRVALSGGILHFLPDRIA